MADPALPSVLAPRPALEGIEPAAIETGRVRVSPRPEVGCVRLSLDIAARPELAAAMRAALDLDLPPVGAVRAASGVQVLGQSPRDWLILCLDAPQTAQRLDAAAAAAPVLAADASAATAVMAVEGPDAAALLSSLCGLDFDLCAFPPDTGATTRLAGLRAAVLRQGPQAFVIAVERPEAAYAWGRLALAAAQLPQARISQEPTS